MAGDVLGPDPVASRRPVREGRKQCMPLPAIRLYLSRDQVKYVDRLVEKLRSEGIELPAPIRLGEVSDDSCRRQENDHGERFATGRTDGGRVFRDCPAEGEVRGRFSAVPVP